MGFGHRVYSNYDPRAKILKSACDQALEALGVKVQFLDIARNLEKSALQDEYFIARKLYPNVDFYSGIILQAMGFPTICLLYCLLSAGHQDGYHIGKKLHLMESESTALDKFIKGRPFALMSN